MRHDMPHLLVERPRGGRERGHHSRTRRAANELAALRAIHDLDAAEAEPKLEALPLRRSIVRDTRQTKWLSENLAPLARLLEKRVGRAWDAVYAEIRAHVRFDDPIQLHILQHLWQYVEQHVVMIDGHPHDARHRRPLSGYRRHFYVCPTSGLLLRVPKTGKWLPACCRDPDNPLNLPTPPLPTEAAARRRRRKRRGSRRR